MKVDRKNLEEGKYDEEEIDLFFIYRGNARALVCRLYRNDRSRSCSVCLSSPDLNYGVLDSYIDRRQFAGFSE